MKLLLSDNITSHKTGDINSVFWTKSRDILKALSVINFDIDFDYGNDEMPYQIKALWDSVIKGQRVNVPDDRFYMLMITNTKSRVVIKSSLETSVGEVVRNVKCWFSGISLAKPQTRPVTLDSIYDSVKTPNRRYNASLRIALVKRAYFGILLGHDFYSEALKKAESAFHNSKQPPNWRCPSLEHVCILKLCLSQKHPEVMKLSELQRDYPDVAYHFGRLLAIYEDIQLRASENVQTTVSERFFQMMGSKPLTTLSKLDSLAKAHLRKIRRDSPSNHGWHTKRMMFAHHDLEQAIKETGKSDNLTFNSEQRGLMVIGYWNEKFRSLSTNNNQEDSDNEA